MCRYPVKTPSLLYSVLPCRMMTSSGSVMLGLTFFFLRWASSPAHIIHVVSSVRSGSLETQLL